MLASQPVEALKDLLEVQSLYRTTLAEVREIKHRTDEALMAGSGEARRTRDSLEFALKVQHEVMASVIAATYSGRPPTSWCNLYTEFVTAARKRLEDRRSEIAARRDRLKTAQASLSNLHIELDAGKQKRLASASRLKGLQQEISAVRADLAAGLDYILPISPSTTKNAPPLLFSIAGADLPNSVFPSNNSNDDVTSSALGMAAQLVNMLAAYLGIPLHYPITPSGSRSLITDWISMMRGPRACVEKVFIVDNADFGFDDRFPLYATGVERYRFEYAVFLLNKDIEQIMQAQNVVLLDLRQTLPNLKNLLLTLTGRQALQNRALLRD